MGYSKREIAQILQIDKSSVNRDIHFIRQQELENIKNHIQEKMPEEYHMIGVSINQVLKKALDTGNTTADERIKLQALSLVKECNTHKLDMITNGTVVSDALQHVNCKTERLSLAADKKQLEDIREDIAADDDIDIEKTNNDIF
jgi:hypothetical protein